MKKLLCPSLMCSDFGSLEKEIAALDAANIDIYHIDIMDGRFVPNFGMGMQDLEFIRKKTNTLIDVHLMIENPSDYIDLFSEKGADIIYFHPETDRHPARTIDRIRANGVKPGIAINPGTSLASIMELLSIVDYVLVMTVNPGFAGQKYLSFVNEKVIALSKFKKRSKSFQIIVDGAISPEKIEELSSIGVDGFVLGTSSLFGKDESYENIIKRLRGNSQGAIL